LSDPQRIEGQASSIPVAAGIGLRFPHHEHVRQARPAVPWFEVHAENYFGGGAPRRTLEAVRRDYPLSLHGVGLSIGSAEGIDPTHLRRLVELVDAVEPALISEHLSWSVTGGRYFADLLPLPMTGQALDIVCRQVQQVQEALRRTLLLENPSSYFQFRHSEIPEPEFLAAVARRTGCGILCDINNVFVSASNHGWDPLRYFDALPAGSIKEFHLAGHAEIRLESGRRVRIDDHGSRVPAAVWALFTEALRRFGPRPTLIEWDTAIPAFDVLLDEAAQAARHLAACGVNSHACAA